MGRPRVRGRALPIYALAFCSRYNQQRLRLFVDRVLVQHDLLHAFKRRQLEHRVHQRLFHDRAQNRARAVFRGQRLSGDRRQGRSTDLKIDAIHREQLLILLDQGILRLCQDLNQSVLRSVRPASRPPAAGPHQFRDQTELDEVFRLDLAEHFADLALRFRLDRRAEPRCLTSLSGFGLTFLEAIESAAADEQDVGRVDLQEILVRMPCAPPCGGTLAIVPSTSLSKAC